MKHQQTESTNNQIWFGYRLKGSEMMETTEYYTQVEPQTRCAGNNFLASASSSLIDKSDFRLKISALNLSLICKKKFTGNK